MKKTALKRYGYQKNVFKKMRKRKNKLLLSDKFLDGDNSDGESNDCADGNKNNDDDGGGGLKISKQN